MKKLLLKAFCLFVLMTIGSSLMAQEITITLHPGWTWISCPLMDTLDFETALGSFTPMVGDAIKSQWGNATYRANGHWMGRISQFYPGHCYRYYSRRDVPVTVTFYAQQSASQVIVTTVEPTEITTTSAVVGGAVTVGEDNHIFVRGVCWGTEPIPDVDGSHTTDITVTGSLSDTLTELIPNTTYYVRAYVVTDFGLAYGEELNFNTGGGIPIGAINSLFSVSESQQVYFSQGNLQYKALTNTWRFAENQWDCLRFENASISSSYDVWIDLFGWGTSGYNHGAVCYQPWSSSTNSSDYYAYGSSTCNLFDQTGQADWGHNAISNGGNTENQWRTLTSDEWSYLIFNRDTPSGIRFAKAIVNDVEGLLVLPDNWDTSISSLQNTNMVSATYTSNIITENDWASVFEPHGVLFLPAGSYRNGSSYIENSNKGYYWTSTCSGGWSAGYFEFNNIQSESIGLFVGDRGRNNGLSVRLAHPVESNPIPSVIVPSVTTIEVTDITQTTGVCGGIVTDDGGSTVTERGACWSTNPNPTINDNHISNGTDTGSYSVNMTNLTANTTYYVRAYATNSVGTAYGEELSFNTLPNAELPTITTSPVTDITQTTAYCGGIVTDDGGATVTERGICWSTNPNPTMSDNYATDTTSTDSYTVQMIDLNAFTTYYVRAYATNCIGTAYGSELSFTTVPGGAINGLFSVSASQQVYFSQGNLQYKASTNTWRFAPNQWTKIGEGNANISSSYTGWIDLFGWGTSGYNHGAYCYQPWSINQSYWSYYAYGNEDYDLNNRTGKADWGYNFNPRWRTLTQQEWNYLLFNRSGSRFAKGRVNGVDGLIILPDNWSYCALNGVNQGSADYSSNIFTVNQWGYLEQKGAVFLPVAGMRVGITVSGFSNTASYWSATHANLLNAYCMYFSGGVGISEANRYLGRSVRLVRNAY